MVRAAGLIWSAHNCGFGQQARTIRATGQGACVFGQYARIGRAVGQVLVVLDSRPEWFGQQTRSRVLVGLGSGPEWFRQQARVLVAGAQHITQTAKRNKHRNNRGRAKPLHT